MLSYSSIYIPGYTGFIPNLESVVGETYGNATRKLLAHRAKLLRLSHTAVGIPGHRYLLHKTFSQPYGHHYTQLLEDRNTAHEPLPSNINRPHFAQRLIYDGDPSTSAAIQSIEKLKADLKAPPKSSQTRQHLLTKPEDESIMISSLANHSLPSDKKISKKILDNTIPRTDRVQNPEQSLTLDPPKREVIQKRRGKLIYRTDFGLLPNYTGYIPGHKFSFGKTWGVSTRDSLGTGKKRPFVWTSLM